MQMERAMGLVPKSFCLGGKNSPIELRPPDTCSRARQCAGISRGADLTQGERKGKPCHVLGMM